MLGSEELLKWGIPFFAVIIALIGTVWRIRVDYRREIREADEAAEKRRNERMDAIENRLNERLKEIQDGLLAWNEKVHDLEIDLAQTIGRLEGRQEAETPRTPR